MWLKSKQGEQMELYSLSLAAWCSFLHLIDGKCEAQKYPKGRHIWKRPCPHVPQSLNNYVDRMTTNLSESWTWAHPGFLQTWEPKLCYWVNAFWVHLLHLFILSEETQGTVTEFKPQITVWHLGFTLYICNNKTQITKELATAPFRTDDTKSHVAVVWSPSQVWLCETLWTVGHQAPLSMGFLRQETAVGCHFLF